jgi:large subunit ribosomal protein L4
MALTIDIKSPDGTKVGDVTLPSEIFDVQANVPLIHQVVVAQLAAARQGTSKTKNRGEVSGTGKKPFAQKGTGRARQGSVRAPLQRHGGVSHGPVPRKYDQRTPKKMIAAALKGVLSDRQREDRIHVVSSITDAPTTKGAISAVRQFSDRKNLLVVLSRSEDIATISSTHTTFWCQTMLSSQRVPSANLLPAQQRQLLQLLVNQK